MEKTKTESRTKGKIDKDREHDKGMEEKKNSDGQQDRGREGECQKDVERPGHVKGGVGGHTHQNGRKKKRDQEQDSVIEREGGRE